MPGHPLAYPVAVYRVANATAQIPSICGISLNSIWYWTSKEIFTMLPLGHTLFLKVAAVDTLLAISQSTDQKSRTTALKGKRIASVTCSSVRDY